MSMSGRRTTVKVGEKVLRVSRMPLRTGGYEVQAIVCEVTAVNPVYAEFRVVEWLWGDRVVHKIEVGSTGGFTLTLPPHQLAEAGIFLAAS